MCGRVDPRRREVRRDESCSLSRHLAQSTKHKQTEAHSGNSPEETPNPRRDSKKAGR